MRCEDLTRELATPTGSSTPAERAGHLAACPGCAEWARRADRLDRAWDATRAPEPGPEALDALWARASAALDAPATLRLVPVGADARRRRWARGALSAAAAAAVLIAVAVPAWRGVAPGPEVAQVPRPIPASRPVLAPHKVTADDDQIVVLRIGANSYQVDLLDDTPQSLQVAANTQHDAFGDMESAGAE